MVNTGYKRYKDMKRDDDFITWMIYYKKLEGANEIYK